jgi:phage gpG-like protein
MNYIVCKIGYLSMIKASIQINNKEITKMLDELSDRLENPEDLLIELEGVLLDAVMENFDSGGRSENGQTEVWEDLKQSTIDKRKLQHGDKYQVLVVTGGLRDSMTGYHDNEKAGVTTNKVYATTMHFGAKKGEFGGATIDSSGKKRFKGKWVGANASTQPIPWGDIPARPFMMITNEERAEISDILEKYLKGG